MINCQGKNACRHANVYQKQGNRVKVTCSEDLVCHGMYIESPEKNDNTTTQIMCKGYGCGIMNLYSPNGINDFDIQIYGCNQCTSTQDC